IPDLDGPGHTMETIRVEYKWKLPRCPNCNIFGHTSEICPKRVVTTLVVNVANDTNDEFAFQPRASNVGFNGVNGICGETNPKAGPSKNATDDGSLNTKGTNTRQQDTGGNGYLIGVFALKALESFLDGMMTLLTSRLWVKLIRSCMCSNLIGHARLMRNRPWVLLGDFNAGLNLEDHLADGYEPNAAMREFKDCVQAMEIDRIMGNIQFNDDFPRDPSSFILYEEHAHYLLTFKEAYLDEERFLKQKAKIEWLKASDSNTAYFHKIVKSKCSCNKIEMVRDASNILYDGDDRAPGPDGFTAAFFKKAWDVVGGHITCVIRVKEGLGDIVSINQSAFVPGRRISDSILLTQELMRNYQRRRGPPSCAFKVDIQKAYETVDWSFLETILVGFGFHPKMVQWIMVFGLVPSIPKSIAFFCNVLNDIKASILNSMPFAEGEMKKGKAKVSWDFVCMPKHKGVLGIRRIGDFNVALMATHIWSILTHIGSLWVKWVHTDIARLGFYLDDSINNLYLMVFGDVLMIGYLVFCGLFRWLVFGIRFELGLILLLVWSKGKTAIIILSRLVVAATSYYIWLERNGRLFKKNTLSPDQIVEVILSMVRLNSVTFKFKKMPTWSHLLLDQWKIPSYCIVHDGSSR
nr:hypothetical protein [Tanacetum cinerariifolium]